MNPDKSQKNDSIKIQTKDSDYFCETCGNRLKSLKSLKRHISELHPDDINIALPKKEKNLTCPVCFFEFKHVKNLVRHQKTKHKIALPYKRNRLCLICYAEVPSKTIISHFKEVHSIVMEIDHLEFNSLEEFQKWKEAEETENGSFYVKECGTKYFDDTVKDVYICHRSGKIRTKATGQRNLKCQGSLKLDGYCPSSISLSVIKSTGQCSVDFIKTHIGHTNDIKTLALSKQKVTNKRQTLANKTTSKATSDVIKNEVYDSTNLERIKKASIDFLFSEDTDKKIDLNMYESLRELNLKNRAILQGINNEQSSLSLRKEELISEVSDFINTFTSEEEIQNFRKLVLKSQSNISFEKRILHSNISFPRKKICPERGSLLKKQTILKSNYLSQLNDPETPEITVIYLQSSDNKKS